MAVLPYDRVVNEDERPIVRKHHALVRIAHWMTLPILAALVISGVSIYWAAPVFLRKPGATRDYLSAAGIWMSRHIPGAEPGAHPEFWFYDHFGLGPFSLAAGLRVHWLFAYLFMATGVLYAAGLLAGGGYRALLPRRGDVSEALRMIRYYAGVIPMKLARRPWPHPLITSKYNALQRSSYLAMPLFGVAAVASGWAMHKPAQLWWLERLFGSYDGARIVHFISMWVFVLFLVPHVVLVVVDGWDTLRSMITGWSARTGVGDE